ncbi:MAG: radical SAM protein, partial [Syntrophobacteraceae bacterium]|nr:radical SAM protein [Syntrophobacteraceae bacterium]
MLWKLKQRQQAWLAEEKGTIHKDWGGKLRIALAFPNRYAVGMSNLGFQSVYGAFNSFQDVLCERVFYPEPEDLELLRQNPGQILSVESQRPISDFHLLAFSIPFENDYVQALEMLTLAGIPAMAGQRAETHPLVAAGGIAVFLNPEPLAPFMDFFFIGEAEAILPDFWSGWQEWKDSDISRGELLLELARQIPGVYVPSLYRVSYGSEGTMDAVEPVSERGIPERVVYRRADLSQAPPCRTLITTPNTEFSDATLIEIGRGCGRGCRFCAAGYVYR